MNDYKRNANTYLLLDAWQKQKISAQVIHDYISELVDKAATVKRELTDVECDSLRRAMWDSIGNADNSNAAIRNWYAALQEQSK